MELHTAPILLDVFFFYCFYKLNLGFFGFILKKTFNEKALLQLESQMQDVRDYHHFKKEQEKLFHGVDMSVVSYHVLHKVHQMCGTPQA